MTEQELMETLQMLAQGYSDLKQELEQTKQELEETRLSAIMANPIMYDDHTRREAQQQLQGIMDRKSGAHLVDLFK